MPRLDAVEQDFLANTAPYVAAMELAIKAADNFREANDKAVLSADAAGAAFDDLAKAAAAAAGAMETAAGRANDLDTAFAKTGAAAGAAAAGEGRLAEESAVLAAMQRDLADSSADLVMQTALLASMDGRLAAIQKDAADSSADLMMQTQLLRESYSGLNDQLTGTIARLVALSAANTGAAASQNAANDATRIGIGYWRLSATAIHWIISGSAELLAVLVPATVAAAAWAFVWVQGATSVYQHLNALFTATEALGQAAGQTYGEELGLTGVFQKMQNAADPDVYQALGAALNVVKETSGGLAQTGLQMGRIFDTFMARLVYDFSAAGGGAAELNGFLQDMVPDLVRFGQVFGNIGAALASFASQMPGLAELLLGTLSGVTGLIKDLIELSSTFKIAGVSVLTLIMGLEEFNRWGSLIVSGLGKIGLATTELSGKTGSYFLVGDRFIGILKNIYGILPNLAFGLATLIGKIPILGEEFGATAEEIGAAKAATMEWIGGLSALETLGIAVVAAGLGFLTYKLLTAQKSWQAYDSSVQDAVNRSSNLDIFNSLAAAMGQLSSKTNIAASAALHLDGMTISAAKGSKALADATSGASQEMQGLQQQFVTVAMHAQSLATKYGTTLTGALALADQAGVKLNQTMTAQAWAMAQIKISDLVAGYTAMGQPLGVVGKDMTAVAIQSGLAGTQMSKLNQAWDQMMQDITGGTSNLGALVESIGNIGQVTQSSAGKLGQYGGQMSLSVGQVANSLKNFGQVGSQTWQNFDTTLNGSAQQMGDWLRTAGAMGVIGKGQLTEAFRRLTAQMLPFTKGSATAVAELDQLAQEGGAPVTDSFKTLSGWVDQGAHSMKDFTKIVDDGTVRMGNMAQVAQQLGTVMQNDIIATMDQAKLATSGVSQATQNYLTDLRNNAPYTTTHQALQTLIKDLEYTGMSYSQAVKLVETLTGKTIAYGQAINSLPTSHTITISTYYQEHGLAPGTPAPFTAPLPAHATGTEGAAAGLALVGERGPELVNFRGGEQVITAHQTQALLRLAGATGKLRGYAGGTSTGGGGGGSGYSAHGGSEIMNQIARELSVLVLRVTGAASPAGIREYIGNLMASIKEAGKDKDISSGQESDLVRFLGTDNKKLQGLVSERAKIAATLKAAEQYASQVTTTAEGTASLSSILGVIGSGPVTSATIEANLKIDLAAIQKFNADIKTLKKLGLDKNLLGQIIQMGPVQGDQVAQALIHGPMSEIQQLNTTEAAVVKASKAEGSIAVNAMYGTGKDAGKGFIEGLKHEEKAIDREMKKIAEAIVKALKRDLKIHSPSEVTRAVGQSVIDGIIHGTRDRLPSLDSALKTAAGHIPSALGSAAGRGGAAGGDINLHLTLQLPSPRENYRAVQTQTLRINRRNADNRLSLRVR